MIFMGYADLADVIFTKYSLLSGALEIYSAVLVLFLVSGNNRGLRKKRGYVHIYYICT